MKKDTKSEERPPWLIRMENGAIGEARTKSFLIDRFWILERSVDIDGADFIIQRRLSGVNLLDKEPPRLGVVQVKFFESDSTTQYLHKEYVTDSEGNPRNEFFLICHTGKEDRSSSYLLSAGDIVKDFKLTESEHSKPNCFSIPGTALLRSTKYKIVSNELSLGRIERSIIHADFLKNRRFMSWALPSIAGVNEQIMTLYQEPLDNWYADIPEQFVELKEKVRRALFDLEEVTEKLNGILKTDDPEKALDTAQELYDEFGRDISLPDDLFDEDFYTVVIEHKERHTNLHDAGMLDLYLKLQEGCVQFICTDLAKQMPLDSNTAYLLKIVYDSKSLSKWEFSSELRETKGLFSKQEDDLWPWTDAPSPSGILSSSSDTLIAFILAGRYGYKRLVEGELVEEPEKSWEEKLQTVAKIATREIMDQIYRERFGSMSNSADNP